MKTTSTKLAAICSCLLTGSLVSATYAQSQTPQLLAQNTYPEDFVAEYLAKCQQSTIEAGMSAQQAAKLCDCTLNEFQAQFSVEEFKALELQAEEDLDAFSTLAEVGEACAKNLDN